MVTRYGMSEELGLLSLDTRQNQFLEPLQRDMGDVFGSDTAQKVTGAVSAVLNNAFGQASRILSENRQVLEQSAQVLLQQETLNEQQLQVYRDALKGYGWHQR